MKTLETVITERGQVSVPAEIRKRMHLSTGKKVLWEMTSPTECKVSVVAERHCPGAVSMLGFAATFRSTRRTKAWMAELREGEKS